MNLPNRRWRGHKVSFEDVRNAEKRILALQGETPETPLEPEAVFLALRDDFDETTISRAMWRLIDAAKLELTSDRKLARLTA